MNIKTATEIQDLNTAALRAYAKEIGVTRRADDTKATLAAKVITKAAELTAEIVDAIEVVEVTPIEATTEETLELLADVAAAAAKPVKNPCVDCGIRSIGTGKGTGHESRTYAKEQKMCLPCAEEGQMSIAHENGHENISEDECWYCHPELDTRNAAPVAPKGTSRVGMVIRAKGTYIHKSTLVAGAIEKAGGKAVVRTSGETTDLEGTLADGTPITMGWNGNAFAYGERSLLNGKQVRNVAAALRVIEA